MPEYDVFLSFKNLGPDGRPSRDTSLAQEVFDHLSGNGLRVFISSVSLEQLGVAAYKRSIDDALDSAQVLVAVGTSVEHLNSQWVRYEWDSFFNDILSGRKPKGRVFSYVAGLDVNALPRTLRENQAIAHQPGSLGLLYNFIANALALHSVAKITRNGQAAIDQLHKLTQLLAESRLLELEVTYAQFGRVFSPEQSRRMESHIRELRRLTKGHADAEPGAAADPGRL